MGKLLSILVVGLFVSSLAGAGVGDDARVLFGGAPSTALARKNENNLLKATDLELASRVVHKECYWLGRYQESLNTLSLSVINLPSYGDHGTALYKQNGLLGAYCGIATSNEESPIAEQNRKQLHEFIAKNIQPILSEIDRIASGETAQLKQTVDNVRKVENDVKKVVDEVKSSAEKRAQEIQNELKRSGLRLPR